MNYFVFIVNRDYEQILSSFTGHTETIKYTAGEVGVGKTSMEPGIAEYPTKNPCGVMYIAPGDWVQNRAIDSKLSPYALSAEQLREIIINYWN